MKHLQKWWFSELRWKWANTAVLVRFWFSWGTSVVDVHSLFCTSSSWRCCITSARFVCNLINLARGTGVCHQRCQMSLPSTMQSACLGLGRCLTGQQHVPGMWHLSRKPWELLLHSALQNLVQSLIMLHLAQHPSCRLLHSRILPFVIGSVPEWKWFRRVTCGNSTCPTEWGKLWVGQNLRIKHDPSESRVCIKCREHLCTCQLG